MVLVQNIVQMLPLSNSVYDKTFLNVTFRLGHKTPGN